MVSKKSIYDLIPQKYFPKTLLVRSDTNAIQVQNELSSTALRFPLIVKPDIGLRGSGVRKINTFQELVNYGEKANFDYLVQEVIPYPNEIGVFYVRHPKEKTGRITGMVSKEFLSITGNGVDSIENLICDHPRSKIQLKVLQKEWGEKLKKVLKKGEQLNLVPFGNHARGAKFIDGSHLITPQLNQTIEAICSQIPEFYYGRFDIMYTTLEELERGENFLIVELNGAASEPTHIYDPKHSIWFAWKELAKHITYMFEISEANFKRGVPYMRQKEGFAEYRMHLKHNKKIVNF